METKTIKSERIEQILRILNMDDDIFWKIIASAAQHKDHDLLKVAGEFDIWSSRIFSMVQVLKEA